MSVIRQFVAFFRLIVVGLRGNLYDFMLLVSREEDADAMFFKRRLKMEGDTELGLYIKNFLDGLDLEDDSLHRRIEALVRSGLPLYARLFGQAGPRHQPVTRV